MLVKWKNKSNPELIIEKLNNCRLKNPKGEFYFDGLDYLYYFDIVLGFFDFPDHVPEFEARNIVKTALFNLVKKEFITTKELLSEVDKKANLYLQNPIQRYVMLTSLSLDKQEKIKPIKINNNQIIFNGNNQKFLHESQILVDKAKKVSQFTLPENYLQTRIHISARSAFEAADRALDYLDLIRSIWNLYFNLRNQFGVTFIGKKYPVNKILTGPIHTIHHPNGKIISTDVWWYDPTYLIPIRPIKLREYSDNLKQFTLIVRNQIKKSSYSNIIEEALRRYVRSLDEWNWNNAFIRLWSVLELLTNTQYDKYDVTIKRAAYIYEDREYMRQILENLRDYRNKFVHHDTSDSRVESYLYKLKSIVEVLIRFHLTNQFKFKSIDEASDFLNLSYEKEVLAYQKLIRGKALKLLGS
jgi:hypothetical protein